jgi:hypothetical protein
VFEFFEDQIFLNVLQNLDVVKKNIRKNKIVLKLIFIMKFEMKKSVCFVDEMCEQGKFFKNQRNCKIGVYYVKF